MMQQEQRWAQVCISIGFFLSAQLLTAAVLEAARRWAPEAANFVGLHWYSSTTSHTTA